MTTLSSKASRLGLALLMLAQFALLWQYAQREIVWAYPAGFDQAHYLTINYTLYREMLLHGLFPALGNYLRQAHATGVMLPLQSAIFYFFAGPGRMASLLINFGYFFVLEVVLFATARFLTGRTAFGWLACGLLLLQRTVFQGGGFFDCRIDNIAYSLYGIVVCLMVRSDGLRQRRWLAAALGGAVLMISFRFITITYLIGLSCTLFCALFGLWVLWRRHVEEADILKFTLRRTAVFGAALLLSGAIVAGSNWRAIQGYYVVGHLTGNEKHIRAAEAGISNLSGHLSFYLVSLMRDHLGTAFVVAWLAVVVSGLILWLLGRRAATAAAGTQDAPPRSPWVIQLLVIGASLFSPWFILTCDESKSGIVANVLAVPTTLLAIALVSGWRRQPAVSSISPRQVSPGKIWWRVAATVVFVAGVCHWLDQLARQGPFSAIKPDAEQIGALYDYLGEQSALRGFDAPALATDMVLDWTQAVTLSANLFERRGRWLPVHPVLGSSIFAVSREKVFSALEEADIILLTTFPKEGVYPFYGSIRPLESEMAAWCNAQCLRARSFSIVGQQVTVYFRRKLAIEGLSGEWVTPDGFRLRLPDGITDWMRTNGKSFVVLKGGDNPTWLPTPPTMSVQPVGPDGAAAGPVCPAEFTRPSPGRYEVKIDVRPLLALLPPVAATTLAIRPENSYFVPVEVGAGSDTRHLVIVGPTSTSFE